MSLKTIDLDEFLNQQLNEEKFNETYTRDFLNSRFKLYKKANAGSVKIEVWTSNHFDERFDQRFISGDIPISTRNNIGSSKKFNQLPNFKPLDKKDLNTVIVKGLNKIITEHNLEFGAYFVISESTRIILPIAVARIEGSPGTRAVVMSTVLHTAMSDIDKFKIKGKEYDSKDALIERKVEDFFNLLMENNDGSLELIDDVYDEDLNICLQFIVEGRYSVGTNYPLIIIE